MLSIFNYKSSEEHNEFFNDDKEQINEDKTAITKIPKTQKVTELRNNPDVIESDASEENEKDAESANKVNIFRKIQYAFDAHIKFILFASVLTLLSLGTIMIFSSSSKVAMMRSNIGDPAFFLKKHLAVLGISFLALSGILCIKTDFYKRWWKIIAFIAFILLLIVLVPGIGKNYNGARRWLRFGSFGFQPSDFAKIAVVIALSFLIVSKQKFLNHFREGFIPLIAFLGIFCAVIVVEPDFGTTLFLALTGIILMLVGGVRFRQLAPVFIVLLVTLTGFVITKFDHVKPRLETYLNPGADPLGKGYQIQNSLIALGSGGATGVGLGNSHQALFYLPEESTDFIFAILGEELGIIGTSTVLFLFLLIMLAGMRLAYLTQDLFQKLLTVGLTLLVVLQALFNMMVVTATTPNKGIALPFISFGGSLTFFYLIAVGIMLRIASENISALRHSVITEPEKENLSAKSNNISKSSIAA